MSGKVDLSTPEGRRQMASQLVAIVRGCSETDALETVTQALDTAYSSGRVDGAENIARVVEVRAS